MGKCQVYRVNCNLYGSWALLNSSIHCNESKTRILILDSNTKILVPSWSDVSKLQVNEFLVLIRLQHEWFDFFRGLQKVQMIEEFITFIPEIMQLVKILFQKWLDLCMSLCVRVFAGIDQSAHFLYECAYVCMCVCVYEQLFYVYIYECLPFHLFPSLPFLDLVLPFYSLLLLIIILFSFDKNDKKICSLHCHLMYFVKLIHRVSLCVCIRRTEFPFLRFAVLHEFHFISLGFVFFFIF